MDASVEFLLVNLKQLILYHHDLISGSKEDLDKLQVELRQLKAALIDASRKLNKDDTFKEWERRVREVVYDVEDTIDMCITQQAAKRFQKMFGISTTLAEAVRRIRKDKVTPLLRDVKGEFANLPDIDVPDTSVEDAREIRQKKAPYIVGFKEEADDFINFLNGESETLGVASIVGMAGLGKTTLAWKIFEDSRIKYEFPVKIWVNISDNLNMKNVLLTILKKFTICPTDEHGTIEELKAKVEGYLKDEKFIIVMDDIWAIDVWNKLKAILPWGNDKGRVVITTRHIDVAKHASTKKPHYLKFLNETDSWQLLQYEVYGKLNAVPVDLVKVGRSIATDCDGLPLSIVVIGGILVEKNNRADENVLAMKNEWEDVSTSLKQYLVMGDRKKLLASIISLSYEKLPYELKNCFLYLGVFPEDADIPVKKLIRLWIAEGFIQQSHHKTLEQTAYENLKELINRNLVMVRKAKPEGEIKICYIHDSVREICSTEAQFKNLNLFQEICKTQRGFEPPRENIKKCRRLCIHSYALDFFKGKPQLPKARSFLCFSESAINLDASAMAPIIDGFGILRVYDAKNIKFPKFPQKLFNLLHLRYVTLVVASDRFTSLPDIISHLWNLQTLMVDTSSRVLEFKADIWKMRQLRHVKTKASITLRRDVRGGEGNDNLQTLSRLSPESCTDDNFAKAKNLITLGIQGDLNTLADSKCLENLKLLNKLKLVYKSSGVEFEKPLQNLPNPGRFPTNLKILVVSGTYLEWHKMSTLSSLVFLEVLKLKENAFKGDSWDVPIGGFCRLLRLHIERSDLRFWTANDDAFPELRFLFINNCGRLQDIPSVLGEKKLELLSLERVTTLAVSCADAIEKRKQETGKLFKLEVAPADRTCKT